MSNLSINVITARKIYEQELSNFRGKLFVSQKDDGNLDTFIYKNVDELITANNLSVHTFHNVEDYKKAFNPSASSLMSINKYFEINNGKPLHYADGSFSFDKEALVINKAHKGKELLILDLSNKEEVSKIFDLTQDDFSYSKKELLTLGILEVDKKMQTQKKEIDLDNILKQYEDSPQNENSLSYVLYSDLSESIYWETLTKEIFDEKLYSDEWLIMKDNNHIIDISLDYDGGFHYKLYPKDTPISDYEEIEKDYKESFLAKGYIEPVLSDEYGHNVVDEKCFEKILEASKNFSLNQNNQSDSNESKKVRRDR